MQISTDNAISWNLGVCSEIFESRDVKLRRIYENACFLNRYEYGLLTSTYSEMSQSKSSAVHCTKRIVSEAEINLI